MKLQMHEKVKEFLILIIIWIFFLILILTKSLKCPFNELTGLHCTGCGITRLMLSLFKLEFYQAFRYNPFVFVLCFFYGIYMIYSLIRYKKIKSPNKTLVIIILVIAILFGILRNIPCFDYLAPTVV